MNAFIFFIEISNSLLLVPDLKFAAATSTSPLKSPRAGAANTSLERSLNDSGDDDLDLGRELEQRKVLAIFHEYLECREIRPRFRKLCDLLQLTRYSGPENEYCIDRKLLFTFEQLLDTIQCSRKQFIEGLRLYRAIEFDGWMRVLESDYEFRIINFMLGLITENSWALDEIEREESIKALDGIAPQQVVEGLFDIYTEPSPTHEGKYKYNEELVARIVAQNILQPGLKFRMEEFMSTWQMAVPEGMKCEVNLNVQLKNYLLLMNTFIKEKYLRGLGIFDKQGVVPCIRSLSSENMPTNIHERMKLLFKTKSKWTMDEMEPYIE